MARWPGFFIVGAPKAGTTSLHELLNRSPDVCMSAVKEPRFFSRNIDHDAFMSGSVTNEKDYLALFKRCPETALRGEASPSYLMDPDTPHAIAAVVPDAKIIAMARNPIQRAHSHFLFHEVRTGRSTRSFLEAIEENRGSQESDFYHPRLLLQPGFYARHIRRYVATFGAANVKVVVYEDFVSDTHAAIDDVCAFLRVRRPSNLSLSVQQKNAASIPRSDLARAVMASRQLRNVITKLGLGEKAVAVGKRFLLKPYDRLPISDEEKKVLMSIYGPDVLSLSQLLGRELPWPEFFGDGGDYGSGG